MSENNIEVASCTVSELFSGKIDKNKNIKGELVIPEYQRPYVWAEKELETPYSRLINSGSSPRNKDKTISTLIFDVIFFLFSIAVVKITFIFYCSVFLRANIFAACLLPFLLYSCCHFRCTVIAIFAVFLITCYN